MVGVQKLLKENNPKVYVISLSLMFINYFYFAYMCCIAIFVYCLITFIVDKEIEKNFKSFINIFLRFLGFSVLSIGISAVVVIPILLVITKIDRLNIKYYLPIVYSEDYYKNLFSGISSVFHMLGRDDIVGFSAISIPCIILMFSIRKKYTKLKIEWILATLGICIPFIGSLFNGMSYCSNRWVWIYCLIVPNIVMYMLPKFREKEEDTRIYSIVMSIIYAFIAYFLVKNNNDFSKIITILIIGISIFLGLSCFIDEKKYKICCVIITMISVIIPAYYNFSPKYLNNISTEVYSGTALKSVQNIRILENLNFDDGSRYDGWNINRVENSSWLYGVSGMDFYISIYNNNIDKFHNDIALFTRPWPMGYGGLNRRSELLALFNVNHFLVNYYNGESDLPYGYEEDVERADYRNSIKAYKSENDYSLVYGFDKSIGYTDFEKMSVPERTQAIMKSVVIDDDKANSKIDDLTFEDMEVEYEPYTVNKNIKIGKDGINADILYDIRGRNKISFDFLPIKESEVWFYIEGLEYESDVYDSCIYTINYTTENKKEISESAEYLTDKNHMYGGKHNIIINLGYIKENITSLELVFNTIGKYTIKDIKIISRSSESLNNSINGLNKIADNIKVEKDKISFDTNLDKEQYVFISVPYSSGWKATANKKPIEVLKADDAFMAIKLSKGNYNIELKYRTPGLIPGIIISLISICVFIVIISKKKS